MHKILPLFLLLTVFYARALPKASFPLKHSCFADTTRKSKKQSFYLQYKCSGNHVSITIPRAQTLLIEGSLFNYGYYNWTDRSMETISKGAFRQPSIDSILNLIKPLAGATIKKVNPFVMGGNTHLLTIASGTDTTKFSLSNSFDYTAFKIVNIINQYLPLRDRIWFTEELIELEKESREWFDKATEEEKKKKDSMPPKTNNQ